MMTRRVVLDITHGFPGFPQALKFDVRKTLTAQRDKIPGKKVRMQFD